MARVGVVTIFGLFMYLCSMECSGAAVSATVPKETRTMRREQAARGVHVNHQGELIKDSGSFDRKTTDIKRKSRDENECEWSLILGHAGEAGCPVNESTVWEEELCQLKCEEDTACHYQVLEAHSGRTIEDVQDKSPDGCFVKDGVANTYFYNPRGARDTVAEDSTPREGTPLCKRKKYELGTAVPGAEASCPQYYKVITIEKNCEIAAECLGYDFPEDDRIGIGDNSAHDFFPEGCFIHAEHRGTEGHHVAYFNPKLEGMGWPSRPVGTPLCYYVPKSLAEEAGSDGE
jgi:hypothetical protein